MICNGLEKRVKLYLNEIFMGYNKTVATIFIFNILIISLMYINLY